MSEQPDDFLQMAASYHFDGSKTNAHRNTKIAADAFQAWTKEYMYESSYAHFHSKVNLWLLRIHWSPKIQLFRDMADTSLQ